MIDVKHVLAAVVLAGAALSATTATAQAAVGPNPSAGGDLVGGLLNGLPTGPVASNLTGGLPLGG
ncbi:hypothetical protein ACFWXK_16235 [Streptomyces sp. NPDC059070]|uniref:hypothetical protein n=1 Tax=unclassified Streptomyces TaxID=2593676 RepID=UPI0034E1DD30